MGEDSMKPKKEKLFISMQLDKKDLLALQILANGLQRGMSIIQSTLTAYRKKITQPISKNALQLAEDRKTGKQ